MLSIDGAIYRVCKLFYKYVALNVLFLVACIPIVTMPAAAAAMFAVARKYVYREDPPIFFGFWRVFKENFLQVFFIGLLFLILAWIYWMDTSILRHGSPLGTVGPVVAFIIGYVVLSTLIHALALLVHIKSTTLQLLKNALKLGSRKLGVSYQASSSMAEETTK